MASLLLLQNRFTSHFSKNDEAVITDDESNSFTEHEDEPATNLCYACEYYWHHDCFNAKHQLRKCCYELPVGQDKQCDKCKDDKHITLIEKPEWARCKRYVYGYNRVKWHCDISNCYVQ